MADGFIVRRGGGVTEQALAPTITEVSVTDSSITFTIKNEDTETATIVYRIDDLTAEGESISLAGGATSSNITESGLDDDTEFIVFATANVTGKVKSNVTQLEIETDPAPVYTAATGGTTEEYDDGGKRYKSHTFTSNGTFEVTTVGDNIDDRNKVDYLIIAGGGSGGSHGSGPTATGGGGAGGYLTTLGNVPGGGSNPAKVTVTETTFSVVIGAGGASASGNGVQGNDGANSSALGVTSTGGGGGGARITNATGRNGGSGGGGAGLSGTQSGGTGISGQGFAGGSGTSDESTFRTTGGGGGASEVGQSGGTTSAGPIQGVGGNGLANLLRTGSNETRAGGGGSGGAAGGTGGSGGGGIGESTDISAAAGTVNTGSGGGGGVPSGAGGSGIVVIRYEIAPSV
jgi:hypothetical protein